MEAHSCYLSKCLLEHSHVYLVSVADFTLQWQTVVVTEGFLNNRAKNISYNISGHLQNKFAGP